MDSPQDPAAPLSPETIGRKTATIPVELSTRFLEHFSEQLYSSPQKAFEELISNGWDAGADYVDVRIDPDLHNPNATMSVLDNGDSMDEEGLRHLWHIAFSPKTTRPVHHGRPVIGKFGIGKLATYVLAQRLTYICKANDGIIRRVTMDYSEIERQTGSEDDKLIRDLHLEVFEVTESEVSAALDQVYQGDILQSLIRDGVPKPNVKLTESEFGGVPTELKDKPQGTWTLVILSALKPAGQDLKSGILRRMLQAALPFGSEMAIALNGSILTSSKLELPLLKTWTIGPDLGIGHIDLPVSGESDSDYQTSENGTSEQLEHTGDTRPNEQTRTRISISSSNEPFPHVYIEGIGEITGKVWLFEDRITGGVSDERGASNGFHVNVLGRVVNQSDTSFGEDNLSHAAWSRFRMSVRADGLNKLLTTDREKFKDRKELQIFRAFLRRVFNLARTNYDDDENAMMPDGGDVLVRSLGVLSLSPLRNVVSEALSAQSPIPDLFDDTGIEDREEKRRSWREETADNIRHAVGRIKFERINDDSLVKFRISDNSILVNTEHPFVTEHARSKAEKELIRTVAMVNLLSDVYALDIGVDPKTLVSIRLYRDRLMRFGALKSRQSGTYIAKLLMEAQHDSDNSKKLEAVVSDALRYIGFEVRDLAKPGEPEGIASAFPLPTSADPTHDNPYPPLYSFSFDAKASKHKVASTGNFKLDGVVEHRDRFNANYALVVAPGFSDGALAVRCEQQRVTPLTAADLGKLLKYTVEFGAIPVTKLREMFALYKPIEVTDWVDELGDWLEAKRPLTIATFLRALENLKGKVPDVLAASTVALECRGTLNAISVKEADVISLARGLAILVPDLIGVEGDKITVNASAERVAASVKSQLQQLEDAEGSATNVDLGES